MERHKARLVAELSRARVRRGCASIDALRETLGQNGQDSDTVESRSNRESAIAEKSPHPRWLRINTLKTTLEKQLSTTFAGYRTVSILDEICAHGSKYTKPLHIDKHIPNLLALPWSTEISKFPAFTQGLLIAQDKASCFPAYLLDPCCEDGDIVDACAAPGNKTTHLAALLLQSQRSPHVPIPRIWACEKDKSRALVLHKMVQLTGAAVNVTLKAGQDFLRLDPRVEPWNKAGTLLLDPSCSGSGIISRDEKEATVILPSKNSELNLHTKKSRQRKRKRSDIQGPSPSPPPVASTEEVPSTKDPDSHPTSDLSSRLTQLSTLQTKLLLHAFSFPSARKITYSTCSVYAEENENVVWTALASPVAKQHGWRILRRDEQVSGMREWNVRGDAAACGLGKTGSELDVRKVDDTRLDEMLQQQSKDMKDRVRDACIRCEMGTKEGTQGFFLVGFLRERHFSKEEDDVVPSNSPMSRCSEGEEDDEEWGGIIDP